MLKSLHKMVTRLYLAGRSSAGWKEGSSELVQNLYQKIEGMDTDMNAYYDDRRKQLEKLAESIDACMESMADLQMAQLGADQDIRQLRTIKREYGRQAGVLSKYQADYRKMIDELVADAKMLDEFRGGTNG